LRRRVRSSSSRSAEPAATPVCAGYLALQQTARILVKVSAGIAFAAMPQRQPFQVPW
jgi:hypothetical protein